MARVPFLVSRVTKPSRASCCSTARTVFRLAESPSTRSLSSSTMQLPVRANVERSRS